MRLRAPIALLLLATLAAPALLLAHGVLVRAEPAAGQVLRAVPREVLLTFNEPTELAVGRIGLTGPNGMAVPLSALRHGDSSQVMVAEIMGALGAGEYIVSWQVAGRDGHPVRGSYRFTVAEDATGIPPPSGAAAQATPSTPAPAAPTGVAQRAGNEAEAIPGAGAFDAESPLFAAVRWIGFAGMLTLIGAVAFSRVIVPLARRRQAPVAWAPAAERATHAMAMLAAVVLLVALVLRLVAQSVAVHGGMSALDSTLITGTVWGRAWLLQLGGIAIVLAGLLAARSRASAGRAAVMAGTIVIAVSFSLSGHAAAVEQGTSLAIAIDTVHILGAGAWMGTLLLVIVAGIPAAMRLDANDRGPAVAALVNAFSPVALIAAGLAASTGVISAWIQLGALDALWLTRYGQVLLIKLALIAGLVGLGAYNAFRIRPGLGDEPGAHRIRRSAVVEVAVGALVLAVTAVLVATPTGISAQ